MTEAASPAPADPARLHRLVILVSILGLLVLSWGMVVGLHGPAGTARHGLTAPHAHGWSGWTSAGAFAMWLLMMVGMMLPAVLPWILLFSKMSVEQEGGRPLLSTWMFVAGYLAVWALYSMAGAGGQVALQQAGWLHGADLRVSRPAGAAVLVTAGLFQLTPWKQSCLRHCRSPLSFFLARWRDGAAGAFGMGFQHGLYCTACCWALMAVAFAVGVMNLVWMAVLTVFLCVEKIAPGGAWVGRIAGVGLTLWGLALLGL